MKTPLVSKNRAANELREQAHALRSQLADPSASFTAEEVEKRVSDIRAIEMRAAAAAEFTADAEVQRQGGDEGLTRVDQGNTSRDYAGMGDVNERAAAIVKEGFKSLGSYVRAVSRGPSNESEAKALREMSLLTRVITGNTSAPNGGEFLLPLSQVAEIFSTSNAQEGVMQYARRYNVPGRTLRIPYLVQDVGTTTLDRPMAGSIANVTIIGEADTKPVREPVFAQRVLTMFKYAAISEFGDEILGDDFTGELPSEVVSAVGGQVINKMNEDVTIDGGGTTAPLGALNSGNGSRLAVFRTNLNQITATDCFRMYARHTHGPNSRWFISRRAIEQLFALQTTNNTMVTWINNLRDKPQMVLLGLPVTVTDFLPAVGTTADISLVNPDFYAAGLRQALTVESSIHRKFEQDITVYRFVARGGGIPLPTSTYAYKMAAGVKVDPHSPFVVLDGALS
jgi:HK97 family phage major capsid protein